MNQRLLSRLTVPAVSTTSSTARLIPAVFTVAAVSMVTITNTYAQDSAVTEFSATLEQRFAPANQRLNHASVFINAQGYRVEQRVGDSVHVLIADTANGRLWFVDKGRSMTHKVPLLKVGDAPASSERLVRLPGFISSVPCLGLEGEYDGTVQFKGRTLERWQCSMANSAQTATNDIVEVDDINAVDELPVTQYYSSKLKLVLYSRSSSGFETEVMDIVEHPVDRQLIAPPADFKRVSIEEFMGLAPPLAEYQPGS
ncbi:hypothetical protein N9383_00280 [Granulosicoccus sp.]|nr:hypothetical protein [Granulosicoccus sp.]